MRKILIASHGELADGMKHTLHFFAGDQIDVTSICAYVDEETLSSKINSYFNEVRGDDEVLVFTDLLGGSVNQAMLPYVQQEHVHIIAGVFLGIILELIFVEEPYLSNERIQEALDKSKKNIVYMKQYAVDTSDIDE